MKRPILTLLPFLALAAMAAAQQQPFQAPAYLISKTEGLKRAWLVAATETAFRYREEAAAQEMMDAKVADFDSIYVIEPQEYTEAMGLYQGRKYAEAKAKFAQVKERFSPLYLLTNSHASLAAFYELECLRKLGDLDGLAAALPKFNKSPLTRDTQLRQLELYLLWDAVRTKSWENLDKLAREREKTHLPADQRAQVAYCHGLALEGLQKPQEAMLAYQTALTADAGASEEIARQSALRLMAIANADEQVRKAMREWGTPNENKNSQASALLAEAGAIAALFEMTLGGGAPLPAEYKELLKYKPKPKPQPKPEAKEETKPEAKPDPKAEAKPDPKAKPDAKAKPDPKAKPDAKAEAKPDPKKAPK